MAQTLFEQTAQIGTCPSTPLPERRLVKSIVASLTIKRIPDPEIAREIERQTNKTLSKSGLYYVRQNQKGILPLVQDHEGR